MKYKKIAQLLGIALIITAFATGCDTTESIQVDNDDEAVDILTRHMGQSGEPVVLVHGNTGYPSDFNRTVSKLKSKGWSDYYIIRPNWGSKSCPACNNHYGSELTAVKNALKTAKSRSKTGRIDVVGHSMGATLAAVAIKKLGWGSSQVRTFVGIAGAFRGLNSCGTYPYNVKTSTCGYYGLSKNSPGVVKYLKSKRWAKYQYSIYSNYDQVTCLYGCTVGGVHTSKPYISNGNYRYSYGHWGLLKYTTSKQESLLDN